MPVNPTDNGPATLPNASIIYGVAAGALFVMAIYLALSGSLFTGALVCLPAAAMTGFALHFMKH
ncbi:MAG: hypothetical protein M3N08_04090 [Pseudomonadota bacterium]|nr:hypothetical protein [Pseudomonadota bacterium]